MGIVGLSAPGYRLGKLLQRITIRMLSNGFHHGIFPQRTA